MTEETALEMARKAALAEMRAEDAEAEVERLRDVLAQVRAVFDLQCPPMSPGKYVDHGAWVAHSWWNKVLGNVLKQAELIDALQSFPSGEQDPIRVAVEAGMTYAEAVEYAACRDCGHTPTTDGCTGPPTPSDLWAGVSPSSCDCDTDACARVLPTGEAGPRADHQFQSFRPEGAE